MVNSLRKYLAALAVLLLSLSSQAFERRDSVTVYPDSLTREYLDTVNLKKKVMMNDYSSFGFQYGASLSRMMFNPPKDQTMIFSPKNFGVTYTKYGKMFGYMPYFGLQVGLFYGQDGYKTRENKETGGRPSVDGAYEAVYDYLEVPVLALFHFDIVNFRILADLGLYGGYRMSVERKGDDYYFNPEYTSKFYDYDIRFDYGIKGGAGFALIFDPVEFHVNAQVRYGFSSLYQPDYSSPYYYRYAYPFDVIISAGVQFQLTKRLGKTKGLLKKEARELVLNKNENENTDSNNR